MSRATKVKYVYREVLEDFILPEPPQAIVKVLAGRGNNLHDVINEAGERFLASMPTKFRRNVWVKRGDFVVVEPIAEGDKVKAEIISILYKQQIKFIKEEGRWPAAFSDRRDSSSNNNSATNSEDRRSTAGSGTDEEDNDDDLFVNTNRAEVTYEESEEDTSDESDTDSEEAAGDAEEDHSSGEKNSVCSDEE